MTEFDTLAQRYIDAWNETDPAARRTLVAQVWADDARYVDPMAEAEGIAEIDGLIGAVQGQFPGWVFRLARPVDAHHDQARFGWTLGPDGAGEAPVEGFDVVVAGPDGRLRAVFGFLDLVPAAA